jgi:hypothetical protein
MQCADLGAHPSVCLWMFACRRWSIQLVVQSRSGALLAEKGQPCLPVVAYAAATVVQNVTSLSMSAGGGVCGGHRGAGVSAGGHSVGRARLSGVSRHLRRHCHAAGSGDRLLLCCHRVARRFSQHQAVCRHADIVRQQKFTFNMQLC